jgi:hypothetical protein
MTKASRIILILFVSCLLVVTVQTVNAQCAMCTTAVESNAQSGSTTANGLNNGIMYLLAAPYLAVAVVGYIWFKKYRRKNIAMEIRDEKLHLN